MGKSGRRDNCWACAVLFLADRDAPPGQPRPKTQFSEDGGRDATGDAGADLEGVEGTGALIEYLEAHWTLPDSISQIPNACGAKIAMVTTVGSPIMTSLPLSEVRANQTGRGDRPTQQSPLAVL